jgi:DNA-binding transcriptional MerR regulator
MSSLLSPRRAALLLGVSIRTLRRWEEKGLIVPFRIPSGQRRYQVEDLWRLVRRRRFVDEREE